VAQQADVIILGVGTGGEDLGLRLAGADFDVLGIQEGLLGGECAYWACIPSKMMVRAGNLVQEARRMDGVAGTVDVHPDWTPVATRIRTEASGGWDDSVAFARWEAKGARFVRGRGRFTGPRTVAVGDQAFTARLGVVIATGSSPVIPDIPGLAETGYWTSHDAVQAEELPGSLVVLGGGATGVEMAQVFARFGVDVTIVEAADRLVRGEEPEASDALASALTAEGVTVRTGAMAVAAERSADGVTLTLEGGDTVSAERLLVAVGRTVRLEGLGLEAAGIDLSSGVVPVDDELRVADGVWALGDVTGKGLYTHVALYQARIVEAGIRGQKIEPADYRAVPRATFSDPEIASVGMTEATARAAGIDVAVTTKSVPATFRGWLQGPGNLGLIKLVADRGTDVLVGATAVGPHGGEVLGMLSLAVHAGVPLSELRSMVYAFPSFHGAIGEALGAYARGLQDVLDPSGDRSLW